MKTKNTHKKKAMGAVAAIFFMGFFIALIISVFFNINSMNLPANSVHQQTRVHFDFYNAKAALNAAEIYLESAHTYSLYQSLYDNFMYGGYITEDVPVDKSITVGNYDYALWYDNGNDLSPQDFDLVLENVKNSFEQKLQSYLQEDYNFLGSYIVTLPLQNTFTSSVQKEGKDLKLISSSIDKFKLEGEHETYGKMNLRKSFSLDRTYGINAEILFDKAKEHLELIKNSLNTLVSSIDDAAWPTSAEGSLTDSDDEIFDVSFTDFMAKQEEFKNLFEESEELNKEEEDGDYKIEYYVKLAELSVIITCNEDADKKSCNFEYQKNIAMKVEVFDNSKMLPISHHEFIVNHQLFIRFYLRTGTVDEIPAEESDVIHYTSGTGYTPISDLCKLGQEAIDNCKSAKNIRGEPESDCDLYVQYIVSACEEHGLESNFIAAIIRMESNWNPDTISSAKAVGLMQLMPNTSKDVGLDIDPNVILTESDPRFDPKTNINYATKYIKEIALDPYIELGYERDNALDLAAAGYNGGPYGLKCFITAFVAKQFPDELKYEDLNTVNCYSKNILKQAVEIYEKNSGGKPIWSLLLYYAQHPASFVQDCNRYSKKLEDWIKPCLPRETIDYVELTFDKKGVQGWFYEFRESSQTSVPTTGQGKSIILPNGEHVTITYGTVVTARTPRSGPSKYSNIPPTKEELVEAIIALSKDHEATCCGDWIARVYKWLGYGFIYDSDYTYHDLADVANDYGTPIAYDDFGTARTYGSHALILLGFGSEGQYYFDKLSGVIKGGPGDGIIDEDEALTVSYSPTVRLRVYKKGTYGIWKNGKWSDLIIKNVHPWTPFSEAYDKKQENHWTIGWNPAEKGSPYCC